MLVGRHGDFGSPARAIVVCTVGRQFAPSLPAGAPYVSYTSPTTASPADQWVRAPPVLSGRTAQPPLRARQGPASHCPQEPTIPLLNGPVPFTLPLRVWKGMNVTFKSSFPPSTRVARALPSPRSCLGPKLTKGWWSPYIITKLHTIAYAISLMLKK